jgi:hypothetical protein
VCRLTVSIRLATKENGNARIWNPDRFDTAGKITMDMAAGSLRRDATHDMKAEMLMRLNNERQQVRLKMREQVHELLRLGASITKMTHRCPSQHGSRACISPKNMREGYVQDGSLLNIKRIHWMFSELPFATHQDVLPQRKSHMDLAVEGVEREMNVTWAPARREGGGSHRNCLQQVCSKMLNDKKQTIIKEEGTSHKRKPMVRRPKSVAAAGNAAHCKRGKHMFSWCSKEEGGHSVSLEACVVGNEMTTNRF